MKDISNLSAEAPRAFIATPVSRRWSAWTKYLGLCEARIRRRSHPIVIARDLQRAEQIRKH